jgi:hypothetical protein
MAKRLLRQTSPSKPLPVPRISLFRGVNALARAFATTAGDGGHLLSPLFAITQKL